MAPKIPGRGSLSRGRKNPASESWILFELHIHCQRTPIRMQRRVVEDGREGGGTEGKLCI